MCGSSMYSDTSAWTNKDGTRRYKWKYQCGHYAKSKFGQCKKNAISAEWIEAEVIEYTKLLVPNQQFAEDIQSQIGQKVDVSEIDIEIQNYRKKLTKLERSKSNLEQDIDSIYDDEMLQKKDKYAYFLSGNYGQVHIQNQKAASKAKGKNILIIKDSFANSFVPFVTQDYENIYMVDLRYYNGDMKSYLQEHNITDVLVLYNISNFISDRNLHKLTGGI